MVHSRRKCVYMQRVRTKKERGGERERKDGEAEEEKKKTNNCNNCCTVTTSQRPSSNNSTKGPRIRLKENVNEKMTNMKGFSTENKKEDADLGPSSIYERERHRERDTERERERGRVTKS